MVGGERFGRYSFIGLAGDTRLEVRGTTCAEIRGGRAVAANEGRRPARVRPCLSCSASGWRRTPKLPRFCGGLVGYFGYDTVRYIEQPACGRAKPDALGVPDILLLVSEEIAIVDNLSGKLTLVVYAEPGEPGAFHAARARLAALLARLRAPVELPADASRRVRAGRVGLRRRRRTTRRSSVPSATSATATSCRSCPRSA